MADDNAALVNAAAAALAAVVLAVSALFGSREHGVWRESAGLTGEGRSGLIDKVRSRWLGVRDADGAIFGNGKLAQDLALGYIDVLVHPASQLDAETEAVTIQEAWRLSGHGIVLLGDPGAGKSVQLLLLAESLIVAAENDERAGCPVVVGLANCRLPEKRQVHPVPDGYAFEEWLVEQIGRRHRLPYSVVKEGLVSGQLVPILDGLDEVDGKDRSTVFRQLVAWLESPSRPPAAWALGCRQAEYVDLDPDFSALESRSTHWTVQPISNEDRVGFLELADRTASDAWRPVIDAIRRGDTTHLLDAEQGSHGILATPLGLTIAVAAYRTASPYETGPADLLNQSGDWDRLWARYVLHRSQMTHMDPDQRRRPGRPDYQLVDAQRWLGNLAAGRLGPRGYIDIIDLRVPNFPGRWVLVVDAAKSPGLILGGITGCLVVWFVAFVLFGAVVEWRNWGGSVGILTALMVGALCLAAFAVSFRFGEEDAGYGLLAVAGLIGLPDLLLIGAGFSWPGTRIEPKFQSLISNLDEYGVVLNDKEYRLSGFQLDGWGQGAITGATVALFLSILFYLAFLTTLATVVTALYLSRLRSLSDGGSSLLVRHIEAITEVPGDYERWVAKHLTLRWWHSGTLLGRGRSTGLLPHPDDWEAFLEWATHRGFLRRVGAQHVWMHETLREWFAQFQDRSGVAALLRGEPPPE